MKTKQLPQGWKEVELGEITECLDGKRVPLNNEERKKIQGNIPYYGANGQVDSINKFIFDEELLLIAEDGGSWGLNQNCAYIIEGKSWVNNHSHVLRIKKEKADISFLKYWLNKKDLNKYISGTTRGKLNQKIMNKIKIPLPPLPIQEQIVSILEKAESLKQNREDADKLTKEYLQSVFAEMFLERKRNTNLKKGNELFELIYGKGLSEKERDDGKYPVYGSNGIVGNHSKFLVKGPGIIIGRKGSIGEVNYTKEDFWPIDTTYYVKPLKEMNFTYLYYLLKSYNLKLNTSTAIPGLNRNDVYDLDFIDSPIPLQQKFASIVEQVEKLKEKQKQSKEEIDAMFNSLMQKAFNGGLVK